MPTFVEIDNVTGNVVASITCKVQPVAPEGRSFINVTTLLPNEYILKRWNNGAFRPIPASPVTNLTSREVLDDINAKLSAIVLKLGI